jgi:16S rRNA (cytosine967-C5)-methyltransferase
LAYVTCSVLASENAAVCERFEARNQGFAPLPIAHALAAAAVTPAGRERLTALAKGHQLQLSPRRTGTDGFFIALFERRP